jgi:predicted acyl esterase
VQRDENEWPLERTRWTRLYLDPHGQALSEEPARDGRAAEFDGLEESLTFSTPPMAETTEITGPIAAKLFVSSTTEDADLFLVLRVFSPEDQEVVFQGALDPHTPIGQGWLRASHRKLDPELSREYRPYHSHDEVQPLEPGRVYECDIEIWPTCIVVPAGYRVALTVRGTDYEFPGQGARLGSFANEMRGCGPFLHNDERDRPPKVFGGRTTIHTGGSTGSHVVLPVIPES